MDILSDFLDTIHRWKGDCFPNNFNYLLDFIISNAESSAICSVDKHYC